MWFLALTQLYFFMNLDQLRRTVAATDRGWDVSWRGNYPRTVPLYAVVVSAILFPMATGIGDTCDDHAAAQLALHLLAVAELRRLILAVEIEAINGHCNG